MATAYLQVRLDTEVFPPIVAGAQISSQPATSMAGGLYADLLEFEADTFHNASQELIKVLDLEWFNRYSFVRRFLQEDCHKDVALAKGTAAFADILRKNVG